MTRILETNAHGCCVLTVARARELGQSDFIGSWYIAPYATQWTVGLLSADDQRQYHVLDESGEPVRFEYEWDAWEYLRSELRIPSWKLPPSPQKLVGPSIGLYPSLTHILIERRSRSQADPRHKRK